MKYSILQAMVVGLVILGAMGGVAGAQDNDGCSNATLNGDYAFTVSGQIYKPVPTGSSVEVVMVREGIAMTHFDGEGKLSQVDYVLSSPNTPPVPAPVPLFRLPIQLPDSTTKRRARTRYIPIAPELSPLRILISWTPRFLAP